MVLQCSQRQISQISRRLPFALTRKQPLFS